jgi:hypothetical protein
MADCNMSQALSSAMSASTPLVTDVLWAVTALTSPGSTLDSVAVGALPTSGPSSSSGAISSAAAAVTHAVATAPTSVSTSTSISSPSNSSVVTGAAVGGSLGLLLLCLLIGILLCSRRRRRQQEKTMRNRKPICSSICLTLPYTQGSGDLEKGFKPCRPSPRPNSAGNNIPRDSEGSVENPSALPQSLEDVHPALRHCTARDSLTIAPLPELETFGSAKRDILSSMPGQRYPPPQYPPPEVPPYPPRVYNPSSPPCKPAARERRPSTRSTRSTASNIRSRSRSSSSASGPVVTFLPGAGRHSLSDGVIPAPIGNQTPGNSTSSPIYHVGKVLVRMPSNSSGTETPPLFQDIEEEGPIASSGNASVDGEESEETSHTKEERSPSRSTFGVAFTTDVPSSPSRTQLQWPSRTSSSSGFMCDYPAAPANTDNNGMERLPCDDVQPLNIRSPQERHGRRSPSALSNRSTTPDSSRLPTSTRTISSSMPLRHKTSQSSRSVSSRRGSSVALIEDAAEEASIKDSMLSGGSPGSWWRA